MRPVFTAAIVIGLTAWVLAVTALVSLCEAVSGNVAGCWPHL